MNNNAPMHIIKKLKNYLEVEEFSLCSTGITLMQMSQVAIISYTSNRKHIY